MQHGATTTQATPHGGDDLPDEHDLGLAHDLAVLAEREAAVPLLARPFDRRRALRTIGGGAAAAIVLAACQPSVTGGGLVAIPEETAGPYPGDGSNGPNVLATSAVVRSDIRSSFGSLSGTASGTKLTIKIKVLDVSDGGAVKPGAAVYLWHADRLGRYSLYSSGITDQNYLRGLQVVDADGMVTFTSIFPGCYAGRWPHIHFEVYPSLAKATSSASKIATSQIAMPREPCAAVYAQSTYGSSARNFAATSITTDNVFRDGYSHQIANVAGSVASGYTARLTMAVA